MVETRIIFLHIPKTAGQSVHAALVDGFGESAVCPARVNGQLAGMSVDELNQYRVFSGHLDWSALDRVEGPKFVFTVLREPLDRLLSFYFFMRKQAAMLRTEELESPVNQGMKAILELSAHEYFTGGARHIRAFLDSHYDNFYTYFFAARHYRGRSVLRPQIDRQLLTQDQLIGMARENLARLDGVFTVDNLRPVYDAIRKLAPKPISKDEGFHVNVNAEIPREERLSRLRDFGATEETYARIEQACAMDREIWAQFSGAA